MNLFVLALVMAPLVLGALVLVVRQSRGVTMGAWLVLCLLAVAATVMAVAGADLTIPIGRTPWGSVVALAFGSPASWLIAAAHWAVVIVHLAPVWQPQADGPPAANGLAWCALGAVSSGLLVNDLLARVVILDIVSVMVALLLLTSGTSRFRPSAIWDYALLRIGDIAFLLMVLSLVGLTGTFSISTALGQAAGLARERLILVIGAGLLAIWVKMGFPPMSRWFRAACGLPLPSRTLVLSAGPPLLGAYLLYRLQPLLVTVASVQEGWLTAGLLLIALAGVIRSNMQALERCLAVHSLLGLLLLLVGRFDVFLLSFVPVRVGLCLLVRSRSAETLQATDHDALSLPWGLERVASATGSLDLALTRLLRRFAQTPYEMGGWLRQAHTGKLRINILITALALVPILLVMLSFLMGQVR